MVSLPTINVRSHYNNIKEWTLSWWWQSGGEIVFVLIFTAVMFVLDQIGEGYGLFAMSWQIQFWVYLFLISFIIYINFGFTKYLIKFLQPFNMTHLIDLNPSKESDIDHLVGGEDLMAEMPVVGSDALATRSAGQNGQSEAYISRKVTKITENNIEAFNDEFPELEVGDLLPVANWRGVKPPDEIEKYESYIQSNTFILEHKMEEYQRLNNSLLIYKRVVKDEIWNAIQTEWDEAKSMDETPTFNEFKRRAMRGVNIDIDNVGIPSESLTEGEKQRIDEHIEDARDSGAISEQNESKNLNNTNNNTNNND